MVRVSCEQQDTFKKVFNDLLSKNEAIKDNVDIDKTIVNQKNSNLKAFEIMDLTIDNLGFQHGDIINVNYKLKENPIETVKVPITADNYTKLSNSIKNLNLNTGSKLKELPVDIK